MVSHQVVKEKESKDGSMNNLDSMLIGVRAYQAKSDNDDQDNTDQCSAKNEQEGMEEGLIVSYYERYFPIGSAFSFPIQATAPIKKGFEQNPATIVISSSSKLSIRTVSVDSILTFERKSTGADRCVSLYISTDANPDYLCICPHLSSSNYDRSTVTPLNVEVCGPAVIRLVAHEFNASSNDAGPILSKVNVFGSVSLLESSHGNAVAEAKKILTLLPLPKITGGGRIKEDRNTTISSQGTNNENITYRSVTAGNILGLCKADGDILNDHHHVVDNNAEKQRLLEKPVVTIVANKTKDDTQLPNLTKSQRRRLKKRKAAEASDGTISITPPVVDTITKDTDANTETSPEPMTKKQRRKLAKQKAKELEEAIARERGYPMIQEQEGSVQGKDNNNQLTITKTLKKSLTRQRSLPGGILVQDMLHGLGTTARTGRKVAIHYRGTLLDTGKVFDKNQTKGKPLVFRVGTGEVIQGLERGIEGMKVGGERVITIPPRFGYGKEGKPEGGIPKNTTLCFTVTLVSVGGNL